MMARRTVLGFGLCVVLSLAGCGKKETMRYKMTVEVETPEGLKSGYAVREVVYDEGYQGPSIGESRPQWSVKGEAVAVDLGDSRTLFTLLTGGDGDVDYGARIYGRALETAPYPGDPDASFARAQSASLYPKAPSTYGLLNTNPLPMLVRFKDINDPKSVERVDPAALDKAFGAGVRLKRIVIEQTQEDVTVGIEKRLGWWSSYSNLQLDGHRYNDSTEFANGLNRLAFSQGVKK